MDPRQLLDDLNHLVDSDFTLHAATVVNLKWKEKQTVSLHTETDSIGWMNEQTGSILQAFHIHIYTSSTLFVLFWDD